MSESRAAHNLEQQLSNMSSSLSHNGDIDSSSDRLEEGMQTLHLTCCLYVFVYCPCIMIITALCFVCLCIVYIVQCIYTYIYIVDLRW